MRKVDVVFFVEHVARELDQACVVKCVFEQRGLTMHIASTVFGLRQAIRELAPPRVVVMPYAYVSTEGGYQELLRAWPDATYVNLAYEQLTHPVNKRVKGPRDAFSRECVLHNSWSDACGAWLVEHGAADTNIRQSGYLTLGLYQEPYLSYFDSRELLARRFGLDSSKRWVLIAGNYGAAFYTDKMLQRKYTDLGVPEAEAYAYRQFTRDSLEAVSHWIRSAATECASSVEIILRPRPMAPSDEYESRWTRGEPMPPNVHIIKQGTAREWIIQSDIVLSSFSTTLIEAAMSGTPMYMLAPSALPDFLHHGWHVHVPRLTSLQELIDVLKAEPAKEIWHALSDWSREHLLAHGDPILNLVGLLDEAARGQISAARRPSPADLNGMHGRLQKYVWRLRQTVGRLLLGAGRWHEHDQFSQSEVERRVARWEKVLPNMLAERLPAPEVTG